MNSYQELSPEDREFLKMARDHQLAELKYWVRKWAETGSIVEGVLAFQEYCNQEEEYNVI